MKPEITKRPEIAKPELVKQDVKFEQIISGETVKIPLKGDMVAIVNDECCDCGLVHTLLYHIHPDGLHVTVFRNDALTNVAHKRRKKEKK